MVKIDLKRQAAERALEYVKDAQVLGLGSGTTAECFLELLAELQRSAKIKDLIAIATSVRTEQLARRLGIALSTLEQHPQVDLTVDGADEVDPQLQLIKGRGGALTREKIVAQASREYIVIVDESKLVKRLGRRTPLPVEVIRFGWKPLEHELKKLGCKPELRLWDEKPFLTDESNYIIDCQFPHGIEDPLALDRALNDLPGLVEHGLFLNMADRVIVASESGVRVLER